MTPTLVRRHLPSSSSPGSMTRARDWAEIQERMLVPLYEAVYERLEVGAGTRLLSLGCGSGLALLMAAGRGASVRGVDADERRLTLARERLVPEGAREDGARLGHGGPESVVDPGGPAFNLVTAFDPLYCAGGSARGMAGALARAADFAEHGAPVVLAGWGPQERCAASGALRVAARLADPMCAPARWRPSGRDDLEELAQRAGLRPDGSGRVACPYGYADMGSAVRGMLSTGAFDAAARATDEEQVTKELAEALHPYLRRDGTVWMPNVFRYLIARV
ncbi:class I SAM-dependent methyltransferase [Streptomyces albireticuli]|uniref:SAM-dependent methyltransferase n=1 Tax=Streptomyces albireticuli TaxID=1940 RepID=A0A2A2DFN6_9ACTN|nr:class I SAM-dependent methyltransferase [Streptomyces albireticuli]MCD9144084.1 class I SAM-dependent methyltransferase [Streptomyces albireticuli]MCD9162273.1 class I SAM-dependent methyltransferase [Streptomyces albireticuli]MCD9195558.1 class I SAM-dependent methyltransferase [Streptomyces albireticuli]PAU50082.1 SAM-dependent methyltransferase [Streptomyces albireticuli]